MQSDIVIEELAGGKRSGAALVFFEDEATAKEAKKLNKTNLEVLDLADLDQLAPLVVEDK